VLHLTGWLARPVDDVEQEKTPFVLPNLYLPGLAEQTALVGVTPRNGWRLVSQDVHGFLPAPDSDLPGYRWTGFSSLQDSQASFRLLPARGTADADILTSVDVANRQIQFQSWVELSVPPAGNSPVPNSVSIEVRRGTGWNPQLEVPAGCRIRETRTETAAITLTLDTIPGRHSGRGVDRRPVHSATDLTVPAVSIRSLLAPPLKVRSWLAISGHEIQPITIAGLQDLNFPLTELPRSLRAHEEPLSQAWRVVHDDWRLRIQFTSGES